jgi:hypothetical protein
MHFVPFELIRESYLANKNVVDLSSIFYFAPEEGFLTFPVCVEPYSDVNGIRIPGQGMGANSDLKFQVGCKKSSTLCLSSDL